MLAVVYDSSGVVFATYQRAGDSSAVPATVAGGFRVPGAGVDFMAADPAQGPGAGPALHGGKTAAAPPGCRNTAS